LEKKYKTVFGTDPPELEERGSDLLVRHKATLLWYLIVVTSLPKHTQTCARAPVDTAATIRDW